MSVFLILFFIHCVILCRASFPCPSPETNENVAVKCSTAGISHSCADSTSVADTRALFSCNRHYIPAGGQEEKFCMDTGNWSDWRTSSLSCRLGCGRNQLHQEEVSEHVTGKVQLPYVPWHVGIFRQGPEGYTYTCGGTLIETDVVVTAASCVSVLGTSEPESISSIGIRMGMYNKLNSTAGKVVSRRVKHIAIHNNYRQNPDSPYADNVALVFLSSPVPLRNYVYPVCSLHKYNTHTEDHLERGMQGFVPVWFDSTFNSLSYLPLVYVPSRLCEWNFDGVNHNLLFESNYCAVTRESNTICEEDTGAGMVFLQQETHKEPTWHLEGIVNSPQAALEKNCYERAAVFLKLKDYKMWILQTIAAVKHAVNADSGNCTVSVANPNADAKCFDANGLSFQCSDSVAPGTVVKYQCQQLYIPVNGIEERICLPGGLWSNSEEKTLQCELDCGRSTVAAFPAILRGVDAKVNQWPWHAAIFRKYTFDGDDEDYWVNVCGGTLINEDTILTAAHCVAVSEKSAKALDATDIKVGLGKHLNFLDSGETHEQTFRVRGIVIHERYKSDDISSLDDDIAFIFLERHVVYSVAVLPVCSHHNNLYDSESNLQNGNLGWVPGWGVTEQGSASTVLKMTALPFVSTKTCEDRLPKDKKKTVQETQYCAGFFNDTNVCEGDSGGGMVFLDQKTGKWHLEGIVSHSLLKKGKCFTEVSFFVKVAKYKLWMVKQLDEEKQRNRGYGWCPPLVPKKGHHVECWRTGEGGGYKESTCHEWQPPVSRLFTQCTSNYYSVNVAPDYICKEGKWKVNRRSIVLETIYKYITCLHACGKAEINVQQLANSTETVWPWEASIYSCINTEDNYCQYISAGSVISNRVVVTSYVLSHWYRRSFRVVVGKGPFLQRIHINDTIAIPVDDVKYLSTSTDNNAACALILKEDIIFDEKVSPVCFARGDPYYSREELPFYKMGGMVAAHLGWNSTVSVVPIIVSEDDEFCSPSTWTIPPTYSAAVGINDPNQKCVIKNGYGAYIQIEENVYPGQPRVTAWAMAGLAETNFRNELNCANNTHVAFMKMYLVQKDIINVLEEVHGVAIDFQTSS